MNKCILMGRLTRDVELRQTQGGVPVASFSVAVARRFQKDETDFINCVAWRQTADFIGRYFRKGQNIGLNGSIQTRTYQDKDTGKNRTAFEVVVNNAYFVENKQQKMSPTIEVGGELDGFSRVVDDVGGARF